MSPDVLVTILGMAAITYAIRAGGLLLASRLPETGFVASWLKHLPGAVLAALLAPSILAVAPGKPLAEAFLPAETIAAAAVILIYLITRSLLAAIAGGVLAVYLARLWLGA